MVYSKCPACGGDTTVPDILIDLNRLRKAIDTEDFNIQKGGGRDKINLMIDEIEERLNQMLEGKDE